MNKPRPGRINKPPTVEMALAYIQRLKRDVRLEALRRLAELAKPRETAACEPHDPRIRSAEELGFDPNEYKVFLAAYQDEVKRIKSKQQQQACTRRTMNEN